MNKTAALIAVALLGVVGLSGCAGSGAPAESAAQVRAERAVADRCSAGLTTARILSVRYSQTSLGSEIYRYRVSKGLGSFDAEWDPAIQKVTGCDWRPGD